MSGNENRNYIKERAPAIISSSERLNPLTETSSNFTYSFNRDIRRISEIRVEWVQIPFTFYIINATNNYFIINNGGNNTITLTPGNYNSTDILTEINTQVDAVIGGNTSSTFSTTTGKITINNDAAITVLAHDEGVVDSPLATLLGFRTDIGPSTTVVGDSALNISGPGYLHVKSTLLTSQTENKALYADNTHESSLTDVKITGGFGDIIDHEPATTMILSNPRFFIESTDIIDIQLVDDTNTEIDLNGLDWSMKLVFILE